MTREETIVWEERAAIMEYLGGLPRADAERRAGKIVAGRTAEAEQMPLAGMEEFQRAKKFFRRLFGSPGKE